MKKIVSFPLSLSYIWKPGIQNLLAPEPCLPCFPSVWPKSTFLRLGSSNHIVAVGPDFINEGIFLWGLAITFFSWNTGSSSQVALRSEVNLLTSQSLGLLNCTRQIAVSHKGVRCPCIRGVWYPGLGIQEVF